MRFTATLALTAALFLSVSCTSNSVQQPEKQAELLALQRLYLQHKENVESQLKDGRSWIRCDENAIDQLAIAIPSHVDFFLPKIEDDFFVMEFVLKRTRLYEDHKLEIQKFSEDCRGRRDFWLRILRE